MKSITIRAKSLVANRWDFRSQVRLSGPDEFSDTATLAAREAEYADFLPMEAPTVLGPCTVELDGKDWQFAIGGVWAVVLTPEGRALPYGAWVEEIVG